MTSPLNNLRVLDFTWFLAGPFATMILSDLGAEVVKVEPPGEGDPTRRAPPLVGESSAYFMSVNRGKRSVVLDLKSKEGRRTAAQLAERADVLVENFVPGTMARWGLDYSTLAERNPRLIYASCSGFGQTGPRARQPAFDGIIQALAGTMSITGQVDADPVRVGFSIGDIGAALFLAIGILAAVEARHTTQQGQYLELGLLDAQIALLENAFSRYFATGEVPQPAGSRHPVIAPFQAFPTKDRYLVVAAGTEDHWQRLCQAIGREDLTEDERFVDNPARLENLDTLQQELCQIFRERRSVEWVRLLVEHGIPCAPIQNIAEAAVDSQILARKMIVELESSDGTKQRLVNTPLRFSGTPAVVARPAPRLGESREDVLRHWLGT